MALLKLTFGADVSTAARLVRAAAAQRIRLGLTGLGAIFLLVLIAAAGMKPAQSVAPAGLPGEPLAVLGVAPGAGPASTPAETRPQPPIQRPARI